MGCCSCKDAGGGHSRQVPSRGSRIEMGLDHKESRTSVEGKGDAQWEDVEVFHGIPYFDNLDNRQLKQLASLFQRTEYQPGDTIVEEGKDEGMFFYVIVRGLVSIHVRKGKHEVELNRVKQGGWFGEIALVRDCLHPVTVRALDRCIILCISREMYNKVVSEFPQLRVSVHAVGRMPPASIQLKTIPFFSDVPDYKLQQLAHLVEFKRCGENEALFRQGDEADGFYFVVRGRVDVSARGAGNEDVHLTSIGQGDFFGEIALVSKTIRTATVTSVQDCTLLFISRRAFDVFLKVAPEIEASENFKRVIRKRTGNSLKALPMFSMLKRKQIGPLVQFDERKLEVLGSLFTFVEFDEGQVIFRQGDEGDGFYVIVKGNCEMRAKDEVDQTVSLRQLGRTEWFGETCLIHKQKRQSTVVALSKCLMVKLGRQHFQTFLQVAPEIENLFRARVDVRTADRLREIPFFQGIKENRPWSKMELLASLFTFEEHESGYVLFQEGMMGDKFYVVVEGEVDISVERQGATVVLDHLKHNDWFGEIALLKDTPRTATVTCVTPCVFLLISSGEFRKFLKLAPELTGKFNALLSHRQSNVLGTLELFKRVKENKPWSKLELLGTLFQYQRVFADQVIVSFGDEPSRFYFIIKGAVKLRGQNEEGKIVDLRTLGAQGYFGEVALLRGERQQIEAETVDTTTVMTLSHTAFDQFLHLAPEIRTFFEAESKDVPRLVENEEMREYIEMRKAQREAVGPSDCQFELEEKTE